ncbi:MAG: helix-turn-helix domain-containing protein [Candidatus Gastranaerophilales bacterium]|nr:helix-turn-helix domain-containing protein [Candidatus Gastranaerophilales bacterium]
MHNTNYLILQKLGKRIKESRIEKNMTQEKLSELSNISSDYLSEIERGKKTPSLKRFLQIAQALEVLPEEFFKNKL